MEILITMGCFGRRLPDQDVPLPSQESLLKDPLALSGWVEVRHQGEWTPRWALITGCGILVVYAEDNLGRTYKLLNLKDLRMKKTAKGVEMRLVTCAKRKVKLRIKGEEAQHWGARIIQPKGKKLGHQSHEGAVPPMVSGSQSEEEEGSSDRVLSRFSYSLPLDSSEESIPRLVEERNVAGKVHSILTDTSMSTSEKREKLSSLAGSTRERWRSTSRGCLDDWPSATCGFPEEGQEESILKQIF